MAEPRKKKLESEAMSLDCVPDDAIINILSHLGDAGLIARCATLNRRWRRLRWFVTRLCFSYEGVDISLLAKTQEIIFSVLQAMRQKGGRLRELQVVIKYKKHRGQEFRASTDWLLHVDTLESLTLTALRDVSWDSDLWRNIACSGKLSKLHVVGAVHAHPNRYGIRKANDFSALKGLTECALFLGRFKGSSVTSAMLESIVATCPSLERLFVWNLSDASSSSLRIASSSLNDLQLTRMLPRGQDSGFKISLETPNLMFLFIGNIWAVEIGAQALHQIELNSPCNLTVRENRLEKLAFLSMQGSWSLNNVVETMKLATGVEELRLSISVATGYIALGAFLQPLIRLKRISFGGNVLECFAHHLNENDLNTIGEHGTLTVYVQPYVSALARQDRKSGGLEVLKALVRNCSSLQSLHIDCSDFVDRSGAFPCLRSDVNDWCTVLLEFKVFFSDRVKLSFVRAPEKQQRPGFQV